MTHVCPACGFEVTTWTCAKCGNDWAATGRILALAHATITATLVKPTPRTPEPIPPGLMGALMRATVATEKRYAEQEPR